MCLSSIAYVEVLFSGFLGLKLPFTAMCLTFFDYCVVLYGSVILCVFLTDVAVPGILKDGFSVM
jgi:hypothetical protein